VEFLALDGISSKARTAVERQRLQADWTMHQTAMQLDWTFCLPDHQTDTADPTATMVSDKPRFQLVETHAYFSNTRRHSAFV